MLAEAYYAVSQVLSKLGHVDLASLAVDRYEWAAERSGDPLAVLIGHDRQAGELISAATWDSAARFLESSRCSIEDQLGGADPVKLSVHETVRVLARQDRRRGDTVHGFAAWCGIS
ncbi:MAG: hypothetical protein LC799_32240 [Actinobacteria bacterium]|nr:hypothetical protein [Actinomycetota bacterium]